MGIGDWGLGIGPNPQSPIPNNNPSAVVGFGIGAAMLTSKNYCYVISNGANDKGKISARLIDDNMFEQMIASTNHYELINEYYSVKETEQRLQASM